MRQGSIRLGRIMGIPLSMDLGVVLIAGLITWTLAGLILPEAAPGLVGAAYWSVGAIGALLFLGSLLAHELAHSVVARRNGVGIEGITLWMLGGFAQFDDDPPTPGAEFRITAAGPATSLALSAVFAGVSSGTDLVGGPQLYISLFGWLAVINGFLGVFNLLPGAPLDGGRILAAALWKLRGDRLAGHQGAATAGKFVGLGIVGLGGAEALFLGGFGGLWTMLIGWFLFNSARSEHAHYRSARAMGDLTVGQAMTADPPRAASWSTVAELVDGPFRHTQHSAVAVTDLQGRAIGVVTMQDIKGLPAERWGSTSAMELATRTQPSVLAPDERLVDALARVDRTNGGYAVVVADGALVGLIGPDEVRRVIELGKSGAGRTPGMRTPGTPRGLMPPPPPHSVPSQRWDPPITAR